ncbi:MAG: hypothetical protein QOD41_1180, partial [Cryptosporangiaceae bacterium]|nr:hypothetical protein [Cryptosporangiaceae bacterium]
MRAGTAGDRAPFALALALAVALIGAVVTVGMAALLAASQARGAHQEMDRRSELVAAAATAETARYTDTVQSLAVAAGAVPILTAQRFAYLVSPLDRLNLAGAGVITFVAAVPPGGVPAAEATWRSRGAAGLHLAPAPGGSAEHAFTIFTRSLDGRPAPAPGADVSSVTVASAALTAARRTGEAALSEAYRLRRDQDVPESRRQLSFVLCAPVTDAVTGAFRGWIAMALRGQDFAGATLRQVSQNRLDVRLDAPGSGGETVTVASLRATGDGHRDLARTAAVAVADRRWTLRFAAASQSLPGGGPSLPIAVRILGGILSVLVAVLVHLLATGRARARSAVLTATADLRTAEAESRRQAGLLGAVLNSISDGVRVVDPEGTFLIQNPAARQMLGLGDGPDAACGTFRAFLPDGVTPFPPAELPLRRALAGERTEPVEMLVRDGGRTEDRIVSIRARPLESSAGRPGAVAVFHDVTELRAQEAELRAFAGVAAHDLKAPIAAVAGFAELLTDELHLRLPGGISGDTAYYLDRMTCGLDRMQQLIDALLTYATARDRALQTEPVDLQELTAAVVSERTAHLRSTAAGDGETPLFPDIYTGPLPVVLADRAMLRQLVDNLIGNAIKYAVPGQPARIDISAHLRDGESRAWIEIADRGIGIPPGQHEAVFHSFHRAHTGGGYAGTGLGLAICQRIAARHGGTIGATDNPGGGTRIHLTLPLG